MSSIKEGDTVRVLCEAKLETGELCYNNDANNPLEIVIGEGKFFTSVENALQNMIEGETKVFTLEPDDAFGPHLDDLIIKVPKTVFNTEVTLEIGSRIKIDTPTGKSFIGTIVTMDDMTITLDMNHLLAGKRLIVKITVLSVQPGTIPSQ
ncbi:MAG: peptidylprolyl isomerase FKBP-type [Thermoplasmatales archaeon]|jgi:FKBP-type peptidyl-prolyl cis-trans isomerase 2|nr:peptidylprolyl isomerase FKBP-type [Thermoplasmatales archaeon]